MVGKLQLMDLHGIVSTKQIVVAVIVSALTATGSGGLIGWAQASDADGITGSIEIPLPRVGDQGLYVYTEYGPDGRVTAPAKHGLKFAWGPEQQFLDGEGQTIRVNRLDYWRDWNVGGGVSTENGRWSTYLVPGGHIGTAAMLDVEQEVVPGSFLGQSGADVEDSRYTWFGDWGLHCFVRNPLQGTTVLLDTVFAQPEGCHGLVPSHEFEAKAADNGTVLFTAMRGRDVHVDMILQDGHPYPLTYAVDDRVNGRQEWRLAGFQAGSQPIADDPVVLGAHTAPRLAQPHVAGPVLVADGNLRTQHPFTMSEAYDLALEAPVGAAADYVHDHPRHYVGYADYAFYETEDRHEHRWTFRLADGNDTIDLSASKTYFRDSDLPLGIEDAAWDILYTVDETDGSNDYRTFWEGQYYHPTPDAVPATMPSAASILAVWQAYTDDPTGPGVGWSYFVGCRVGAGCDVPEVYVWGGRTRAYTDVSGTAVASGWDLDTMTWYNGQLSSRRDESDGFQPGAPTPAADERTFEPNSLQVVSAEQLTDLQITAAAAGIGIGAGLLVWLWPVLKTGIVGLFTRVRQDRLLDHPVRSRLMAEIAANPGVHQTELVRVAAVGKGATDMHLRRLKSGGLISVSHGKGYTCYFPKGAVDRRVIDAAPVMKSKVARALVQYVNGRPGVRATELRAALQISPSTLHYHMKRLEEAGVIEIRQAGNGKALDLTHTGRMVAAS